MITAGLVLRFLTNLIMTKVNVSKISCSMSFIDQYKGKKVCLKNKALQKKKKTVKLRKLMFYKSLL